MWIVAVLGGLIVLFGLGALLFGGGDPSKSGDSPPDRSRDL